MGEPCVQDGTEDTALGDTSVEDDCGGTHPDMLGSVGQELLYPQTEGGSKLQCLQFVAQLSELMELNAELNKQTNSIPA